MKINFVEMVKLNTTNCNIDIGDRLVVEMVKLYITDCNIEVGDRL